MTTADSPKQCFSSLVNPIYATMFHTWHDAFIFPENKKEEAAGNHNNVYIYLLEGNLFGKCGWMHAGSQDSRLLMMLVVTWNKILDSKMIYTQWQLQ
jgi:hypothetical protein